MPIVQQGSINTTALIVPDIYVQIVPPQNLVLNGVPTDIVGIVGTASWGPVNQPAIIGNMASYASSFGPVMARKYDMGTQVATAVQQGAQNFRCVRVTDGTDTAASVALLNNGGQYPVLLTARYSGSAGNNITVAIAAGAPNNSWTLTITMAGFTPEVFPNIPAPNFAAFWTNVIGAVNSGLGPLRGPSQLVVASAGTAGAVPPQLIAAQALANGSDGATGVVAQTLLGVDTLPRKGLTRCAARAARSGSSPMRTTRRPGPCRRSSASRKASTWSSPGRPATASSPRSPRSKARGSTATRRS